MKNHNSARLYAKSVGLMLTLVLLCLASGLFSTSSAVSGTEPLTGAIWTTDSKGGRVNGNLYTNPRSVYLGGGPHKVGALGLTDGWYYFQVTDTEGKTVLSTDDISKRMFEVKDGYINSVPPPPDGHKSNPDTTRGYGIVVQLWPFQYSTKEGREYKVMVTRVESYALFGFIPSLSKTDNFKVNLEEVPKYFELWVTEGICELKDVGFFVNYTIDVDGYPASPWTTGQLVYDRDEGTLAVFREETAFALGTYIHWQFYLTNTTTSVILWTSDAHGPELIFEEGMINKELLFKIGGHKYDNPEDKNPIEGWTITLFEDGGEIADALTDYSGYYMFIGVFPGTYIVSCEGWASGSENWYEFDAEVGVDWNLDFYNYEMMRMSNLQDTEIQSFSLVFTPSNEAPDRYKLSSTNPGSFHFDIVAYGTPGELLDMEILLPPDQANGKVYDSPNFILHHESIGGTSVIDLHVYKRQDGLKADEITELFTIATSGEKGVSIQGELPDDCESIIVSVHLDYQISASLSWEDVLSFNDFMYTFTVKVYGSIFGGRMDFYPTPM